MLQAVSNDAKGKGLGFRLGVLRRRSVGEDSGKLRNLSNPPAVGFLFDVHSKCHGLTPDAHDMSCT